MMELSVTDIKSLNLLVKEKFNYDFSNYAASSYKRRISRLMELKKTNNVNDLAHKIEAGLISREDFLCEVTVNVTEMYRDPSFWMHFRELVYNFSLTNQKIRIWHAGCSSGEEVYSMVILLQELNLLDKTELIATDIDMKILSKAKEGKISVKAMEVNKCNYSKSGGIQDFSQYFNLEKDAYLLDSKLLSKVKFSELDLVQFHSSPPVHFILCRNVLIYFNHVLQNAVLEKMHQSLDLGGYFILGSKESLGWSDIASKFMTVNAEEKIYRKVKE